MGYGVFEELEKLKKKQEASRSKYGNTTKRTVTPVPEDTDYGVFNELRKIQQKQEETRTALSSWFEDDDDDIAPVKETKKEEEEERTWFQRGAFDDGFSLKNTAKAIIGSAEDVIENVGTGIAGMGEKIVDTLAWAAPYVAQGQYYQSGGAYQSLEQQKQFEESIARDKVNNAKFIQKDLYDEEKLVKQIYSNNTVSKRLLNADPDDLSVLGEKSDALAQSAGQLAATAGLQAVGVPWYLTTGVTSFGGETENALKSGATMEEAGLSAAITAGAEILTEKISGGIKFGGKTLDDALVKEIARGVSNKTVRTLTKLGFDAAGEGFEEVLSGAISAVGQKLTYADDKELSELFSKEDAWDSFIGGAVLGGGSSVINVAKSIKNGIDPVSELTKNEQKVVEKEYNERVAEAEKQGKVSQSQKSRIYDQVLEEMEKGYISTDSIEEALGGETYNNYKSTAAYEENILKEFEELGKKQNPTLSETARYNELSEQVKEIKDKKLQDQLKGKLSDEVKNLVAGDRLAESYNERSRRQQVFQADLTQYDEKQKAVVQKAVESGILNNTNRTHEFVDMVAKISADKGVLFDFTNNAKLKESGFALNGATVNGYKTADGIVVNVDSAKSRNFVVGHEITHVLEGTELYGELQQAVFDFAKTKGEYDSRLASVTELYKKYDPEADPLKELTSDLVGEYVFSDPDFVNNLSAEHKNVFQKVYNEIKYLLKVATAGSKEARELERVKKIFEQAYRESATKNTADSGVKYDIAALDNGNVYVTASRKVITGKTKAEQRTEITKFFSDLLDGKPSLDIQTIEGDVLTITKKETANKARDDYKTVNGQQIPMSDAEFTVKMHVESHIDEVAEVSKPMNSAQDNKNHPFAKDGFTYRRAYFEDFDGQYYEVTLSIGNNGTIATVYNVGKIKGSVPPSAKLIAVVGSKPLGGTLSNADIPQNSKKVNEQFSLSDSAGRQISKEQQEYFKDSKVRDENGNLKVMYHGTPNGDFTVFKDGTYFTDNKEYADRYQNPSASSISSGKTASNPKTFEVYLDIKKPFDLSDPEAKRIYIEDYIKGGNAMGINPYLSDAEYAKINTIDWTEGEDLREFLTENGYDYDGLVLDEGADGGYGDEVKSRGTSYVVFNPEQIKNIDNAKPTNDADIRKSISDDIAPQRPVSDPLTDLRLEGREDIAPVEENATTEATAAESTKVEDLFPDDTAPIQEEYENLLAEREDIKGAMDAFTAVGNYDSAEQLMAEYEAVQARIAEIEADDTDRLASLDEADAPPELDNAPEDVADNVPLTKVLVNDLAKQVKSQLGLGNNRTAEVRELIERYSNEEFPSKAHLYTEIQERFGTITETEVDEDLKNVKNRLRTYGINVDESIKSEIADYAQMMRSNFGKVRFSKEGLPVDVAYNEFSEALPGYFPEDIYVPTDQLMRIIEVANMDTTMENTFEIDWQTIEDVTDTIMNGVAEFKQNRKEALANRHGRESFQSLMESADQYAPPIPENVAPVRPAIQSVQAEPDDIAPVFETSSGQQSILPEVEVPKTRAEQRRNKQEGYTKMWEDMLGDTSTWKDMPIGLQYKTKTLRRILRKVVKDADGKSDFQKADRIYDELETKYDHNEALLKRESQNLKEVFFKLNLNHVEDTYAHMLGELRHNPDTELTEDVVKEYYEKHKGRINTGKVDKAIVEARKTFDDLIVRVNEVLKEQGMKEIPYRKGYFPHFTNPKQGWLAKLLNWKTIDTEIPTSIAGLTEAFKPQRSWQSFNKQRTGDTTDYSLYQGLDTYIHGALDWIYHIEDLQKRRALENHIRYTHSDEGVQERIQEINAGDYDADEAQAMINAVLDEAENPLSGLVRELMNRTNTLANKKSSMDRGAEDMTNRKIYSTMTNLNNRITANMVVGSFSSALTNFIPIVQSWHQVSPIYSVRGIADTVRSAVVDDGTIAKSDFLTNRLVEEENLYQTGWDKVTDKAAFMMNVIDNITAQTVWRSKYLQNVKEGMSENQAIKDADQFAKNVIGGRSRGNAPTVFDAKNPLAKIFTSFQLEVANQYGYMFEDVVQDSRNAARLVKGYATAFLGAYLYNSLYSSLVGRDAAFDPISIVEDLLKGLFGDDEEEDDLTDDLLAFGEDVVQKVPFVGGLFGGGRVPISAALPYSGDQTPFKSMLDDASEENWGKLGKEFLKPIYYLAMPVGGGQLKKTVEGLKMFDEDLPIAGSYTDSGNLRFPVEDTTGNRVQAALFGQWASENARDYFDNERKPLQEKQIQELIDSDMPIRDYWDYREGLAEHEKLTDKADYIDSLDLPISTKNMLVNNVAGRKEPIDMADYGRYGSLEEMDFATKNPEKYMVALNIGGYARYMGYQAGMKDMKLAEKADYISKLDLTVAQKNLLINSETDRKEPIDLTGYENFSNFEEFEFAKKNPEAYAMAKTVGGYEAYTEYSDALGDIKADKDKFGKSISGTRKTKVVAYINSLNIPVTQKYILLKSEYPSTDDYNYEIIDYVNSMDDMTFEEKIEVLRKLDFDVDAEGNIYW
jgi:uncharacterized protein YxjI